MRPLALIVLFALAGCQSAPRVVRVPVEVIVRVPAALTAPCDEVPKFGDDVAEAIRLANSRLASLKKCNADKAAIRGLVK